MKDISAVLDTLYEAEALLEMAIRRGDGKVSDAAARLVAGKCRYLCELTAGWDTEPYPAPEPMAVPGAAAVTGAVEMADDEALADNELLEAQKMAAVDPSDSAASDSGSVSEEFPQVAVSAAEPEPAEPELAETTPGPEPAPVEAAPEPAEAAPAAPSAAPKPEPVAGERYIGPKLTPYFTLIDKFLFIRGLFGGDRGEFDRTLDHLRTIPTFAKAYDYLANTLQWDLDDPDAKAFVEILDRYYN